MLRLIFTSDYEIHGNGEGSPFTLMVESTDRMLELFDRFGARLTIMADVAEIMRFRRHRDETGSDDFAYEAIVTQLRHAVRNGHDVQLHIHPSYIDAEWRDGRWRQNYDAYNLALLGFPRLFEIIRDGKRFLEATLRPVNADYQCRAFRAANWSMQPSADVVRALLENGIRIDTSVFKYGRREGLVQFDYADAWSDLIPWPASGADVCRRDCGSELFEVPIYAEKRWLGAFLSPQRVYRLLQSRMHRLGDGVERSGRSLATSLIVRTRRLFGGHAWKLDFNQCTGPQLIRGLLRAEAKAREVTCDLPLVLIGHSKLFTSANARSLTGFLEFIRRNADRFGFGTFADVDLMSIRQAVHSEAVGTR